VLPVEQAMNGLVQQGPPAAPHVAQVPLRQVVPAAQARVPAQQGWPGPPQKSQVAPLAGAVQRVPGSRHEPPQQGWPLAPQALHRPAAQAPPLVGPAGPQLEPSAAHRPP
jgi:hypothetical protein